MRIIRKILVFLTGVLALVNLVGAFLDVIILHWRSVPWALVRTAIWAGLCIYLVVLDRRDSAPASEEP